MKKITDLFGNVKIPGLKKLLRLMKLTVLFILISVGCVLAGKTYSQTKTLTLHMENSTVKEVLAEIESQSEFRIMYSGKFVDVDREVSLDVKNQKIESVLNTLFAGTDVGHTVKDRFIVLITPELIYEGTLAVMQQQRSVSGTVTDESGLPLPGVTVLIKGTTQGTVTSADGEYTLRDIPEDATLQFSFVGMLTQEIVVGNQNSINVTMVVDAIGIEEVVAIGYGTQKKSSITGAITKIDAEELEDIPVSNISNALMGRLSGVLVNKGSGAPGYAAQIQIRANNTWKGGNDPLYVIDGIISDKVSFNGLDYSEVEDITVLKDAASAAIYGARGGNGVILVTTKTGKEGVFRLNYNYSYSFGKPSELPEMMPVPDMMRYRNQAQILEGLPVMYDEGEMDYITKNDPAKANWDLAYRDPSIKKHALTASGGSDRIKYFVSGAYYGESAFINNADYKKINIRSNVDFKITENLSGEFKMAYNQGENQRFPFQEDLVGLNMPSTFGGLWGRLLYYIQDYPPVTSDGQYIDNGWIGNMVGFINDGGTHTKTDQNTDAMMRLTYKIPFVDGLSVSGQYSQNITNSSIKLYEKKHTVFQVERSGTHGLIFSDNIVGSRPSPFPSKERVGKSNNIIKSYQLNFSANYTKSFDKHNINTAFIYEQSEGKIDYFEGIRENFPLIPKDQFWATSSSREDSYVNGSESEYGRSSYIGRFMYNYDEKYFINLTARHDGSMLFGADYRWGTFPSVSTGWVLSKEDFFDVDFINFLKLRSSLGWVGNDAVGGWKWKESYQYAGTYLFSSLQPRVDYSGIVNKKLTWEKTRDLNIGFDSRFLEGFLLNMEYYNRHNYDILDSRILSIPVSFGGNMPPENYGIVDAQGFEVEMGYTGNSGELKYSVTGNFSYSTNEVKLRDVPENVRDVNNPNGRSTDYISTLVYSDIIRTQADLDALPEGYTIFGFEPELGVLNFEDVSGVEEGVPDGKIDSYDAQILEGKHYNPPYIFGLNLNADWKGLGIDVFLQGRAGGHRFLVKGIRNFDIGARPEAQWLDSWTPDNIDATYPQAVRQKTNANDQNSTFWLKNDSYLRVEQVNLKYTLPQDISNMLRLSNVTFMLSGTNLLTFTGYEYGDPAANKAYGEYQVSAERFTYPTMRNFTLGINVGF